MVKYKMVTFQERYLTLQQLIRLVLFYNRISENRYNYIRSY